MNRQTGACPAAATAGNRHVDGRQVTAAPSLPKSPQLASRVVAEHCAVAAGEDRRHPPSLGGEQIVPDRVNTAMNAVEPSGRGSSSHLAL
jgi:phage tail sheath gpL-like